MATQAYWKLLLAQVKPLPRFFSQLDFAVAAEAQARTHRLLPSAALFVDVRTHSIGIGVCLTLGLAGALADSVLTDRHGVAT